MNGSDEWHGPGIAPDLGKVHNGKKCLLNGSAAAWGSLRMPSAAMNSGIDEHSLCHFTDAQNSLGECIAP